MRVIARGLWKRCHSCHGKCGQGIANSTSTIALALLCRCIGSVRHECATEGITAFYSMLTHNKFDNGTHRGKDTLYCVDFRTLFKAPVYELSSL